MVWPAKKGTDPFTGFAIAERQIARHTCSMQAILKMFQSRQAIAQVCRRFFMLLLLAGVSACSTLPALQERTTSHALAATDTSHTLLGRTVAKLRENANAPDSGSVLLADPFEAFAARLQLIKTAEQSLDLQYYIWRDDVTGRMLLGALDDAARRGVRIRILLDDNGTHGLDEEFLLLSRYPNTEVRLFNPFYHRKYKVLDFIADFRRVHRRMHNKAFIADNQVAITGGRNIADGYFAAKSGTLFTDLDVMAIGPIVHDTSADFDRYWQSPASYPLEQLVPPPSEERLTHIQRRLLLANQVPYASDYRWQIAETPIIAQLLAGELNWTWAPTQLVSDDPLKIFNAEDTEQAILPQLLRVLGTPENRLVLVSPYFIPGDEAVTAFATLSQQGVHISVFTNSFKTTDVAIVHAGYIKYRKALLDAGIELIELREKANPVALKAPPEQQVNGETDQEQITRWMGSSGSSLHAKTFIVDQQRVFIGSFNFDPRSIHYNTEMGFVIDDAELALLIETQMQNLVADYAFQLQLDENGRLLWQRQNMDGSIELLEREPDSTLVERILLKLFSLLPIERLL